MRIETKERMYKLLMAGRFGNYVRAWDSLAGVLDSGYHGHVSIRSMEIANPVRLSHVPAGELAGKVESLPHAQRHSGLMFSESPPDESRVIQGEWDGEHLTYSFAPYPMRIAFDHQRLHASGPAAYWMLRGHLDANDSGCSLCHAVQHGAKFHQMPGMRPLTMAELLGCKMNNDPDNYDPAFLQLHSVRRLEFPK